MSKMSQSEATELFRREPDSFIELPGSAGAEIAYRRVGAGPDVLFVHGWPVSGATFRKLLPYLVDHVTCHIVDLPGAGSSRYSDDSPLSVDLLIESVRRVIDHLNPSRISVVGHDSGGMIARHATVGDERVTALGLIDTEPTEPAWRFKSFIGARNMPGFEKALGWLSGKPRLRRSRLVFGDVFADRSHIDGEFGELFLDRLHNDKQALAAAMKVLRSFDMKRHVNHLASIHRQIDIPVHLVWGDQDKFFPVAQAREMVSEFANATLTEIKGTGVFCHEEDPAAVAAALLPTLTAST